MTRANSGLFLAAILAATPALAGMITVSEQGSETAIPIGASYEVVTKQDGTVNNGLTRFSPQHVNIDTSIGVLYTNYLSALPGGSTLTGATLNYAGFFMLTQPVGTLVSGAAFVQPVFSAGDSHYKVTISSPTTSTQIGQSQATGYDLWPLFQADLLAGNQLQINWSARANFNADLSSYAGGCASCDATFSVTASGDFSAPLTSNALSLEFTSQPAAAAPEPATFLLSGLGAVIGGIAIRKRRKADQQQR